MSRDDETAVAAAEVVPLADAPLSTVKETVLKKRKRDEQWALVRKERQGIAKAKARSAGEGTFKRAEQYVKEFRLQERDFFRFKRESQKVKTIPKYVECGSKLLFVIRIGGTADMHARSKKILYLLRLRQIYQGVFMKADRNIMSKLRTVEPYVTYGYPNLKSVMELIYKRGHGKVDNVATALTDNAIIEEALGKYGIICIQDLVNEMYKIGPHFKDANDFLRPFKLNPPAAVGNKPGNPFVGSADGGNRFLSLYPANGKTGAFEIILLCLYATQISKNFMEATSRIAFGLFSLLGHKETLTLLEDFFHNFPQSLLGE